MSIADIPENAEKAPTTPLAERVGAPAEVAEPQHPDVVEWRPAVESDIDTMMQMLALTDAQDHPTWATPRSEMEELFEISHMNPQRFTRLGFTAGGELIAMAGLMLHPAQDAHVYAYLGGRVHPAWRRRGIGREMMRWEYETAQVALAETGKTLPGAIFVYAHEPDAGARALGADFGLRQERWFTTMLRDLSQPIPEVACDLPIVPLTSDLFEAARLARNDAFRDHWGSLQTPPERWEHFTGGPTFRGDLSRVVLHGDRIVAFALASVHEEDWALQGYTSAYIELIGVARDYRGRKLAPAVIAAMLRAARDAGLEKANLDVDTESPTGANSLYGNLGFEPTDREVVMVARF
ncbi:GNAT family N-acetyltransferase [Microbacterium sediminicola]|uniref:GNAT family N-acetyltransferase n=1 Tax=Microbacterium sediminicola TaxID=415210 RepID=UPI0031E2569E